MAWYDDQSESASPGGDGAVSPDVATFNFTLTPASPSHSIDVSSSAELFVQALSEENTQDYIFEGSLDSTDGVNGEWTTNIQSAPLDPAIVTSSFAPWWPAGGTLNGSIGVITADVSPFRWVRISLDPPVETVAFVVRASAIATPHVEILEIKSPFVKGQTDTAPTAFGESDTLLSSIGETLTWGLTSGNQTLVLQVGHNGSSFSGFNAVFEATANGSDWVPVVGVRSSGNVAESSTGVISSTPLPTHAWTFSLPGYMFFRVRVVAAGAGTQYWVARYYSLPLSLTPYIPPTVPAPVSLATLSADATIFFATDDVVWNVEATPVVRLHCTGTFAGVNDTFEASLDGTVWTAVDGRRSTGNIAESTTGVLAAAPTYSWEFNLLGYSRFRVRNTALTSGTQTWAATGVNAAIPGPSPVPTHAVTQSGTWTASLGGSGTTSAVKAEDVAHATGDLGIPAWLVRAPTVPVAGTSAAGDYGYSLGDSEGKTIISGSSADPSLTFDSNINLTTTSDVALRAAQAAGIRTYVTDLIFENTGGAAARVLVRDGTTTRLTVTVQAGQTLHIQPRTPLRGTAATALNAQLGAAGTVTVTTFGYSGV